MTNLLTNPTFEDGIQDAPLPPCLPTPPEAEQGSYVSQRGEY
jgi:hypothetical protein